MEQNKPENFIYLYEQVLVANPSYRKQLGAFYTPEFIVKYMVETTLQKAMQNKTWEQIQQITVVDFACGAGCFLVEVYQFFLTYYQKQKENEILSLQERKEILFCHIFGVDLDKEAVAVCKKVLLLLCYENQGVTEIDSTDLDWNIKCGNSLISKLQLNDSLNKFSVAQLQTIRELMPDYKKQVSLYKSVSNKEAKRKIVASLESYKQTFLKMFTPTNAKGKLEAKMDIFNNSFEWRFEFPEILDDEGSFVGFDVVIGNPPYGVDFKYKIPSTQAYDIFTDSSEAFMLLSKRISKVNSFSSIILPKSILFANAWLNSRKLLLENTIYNLVDTGISFAEVDLETVIYVMQHNQMPNNHLVQLHNFVPVKKYAEKKKLENLGEVAQSILQESEILTIVNISPAIQNIFEKVRKQTFLKDFERQVFRGLYIPDNYKEQYLDKGNYLYINKVPDVSRYHIDVVRNIDLSFLPKLPTEKITKLSQDRIIIKVLRGARLQATFCPKNTLSTEKLINLIVENVDLHYTLAIVNSKLVSFYFNKIVFSDTTETSRVMDDIYLSKIPFPTISIEKQEPFIALVKQILDNKTKQFDTKILETEIDNLVYKLYDLTAEEINIVENGTR
jgi:adenine-specific DNA-methyltransferase